jgi:hypothetical protein
MESPSSPGSPWSEVNGSRFGERGLARETGAAPSVADSTDPSQFSHPSNAAPSFQSVGDATSKFERRPWTADGSGGARFLSSYEHNQ